MIYDGEKDPRPVDEAFDYVIVGSGAAGASAARVLADTGASIAIVEEGPYVDPKTFHDKVFKSFTRLFRNMGGQVARGRAFIPVVQGSCVGGSTVVNSAIVWRLPEDIWQPWEREFGIGRAFSYRELSANWDLIERELSVAPTPSAVWGNFNRLMDDAKRKLGVDAGPTRRYVRDCQGSAQCLTGCPHGAKQSMLVSYLPYAEKRGATIFAAARVDDVEFEGGKAVGVRGWFHVPQFNRNRARFRLRARKGVLVAASAIQTPQLLQASGVRSPHLGRHFQGHPGSPLIGLFDSPLDPWFGATQGYDAEHHRRNGRFKIETISLPPEIAFTRMPGVGRKWLESIGRATHSVIWAVQMRGYARGRVRKTIFGPDIQYDLTPQDMDQLRRGLRFTAELMFAAGAREVITGIHGFQDRLTKPADAALLEKAPLDPACYSFILSHLFGTARMSPDPKDGVVGTDFAVHGRRNLYVLDSSLFPTNMGVNPQHTIMAVAMQAAKKISEAHP
jgi:choline dehydrogenase-like flavoprotein